MTSPSSEVMRSPSHVTIVLGSQWGDEGKGKVVDLLAEKANIVARCQVSTSNYFVNVES